jgi:hypothetical protein
MIVIIKSKNNRQIIIKALSMLSLVIMFYLYYNHMATKFRNLDKQCTKKIKKENSVQQIDISVKLERIIYDEAVTIVNLLEQKNIKTIKIVKNKLLIICNYGTDIESVRIRYGSRALIKHTTTSVKLALDLGTIIENNYENK